MTLKLARIRELTAPNNRVLGRVAPTDHCLLAHIASGISSKTTLTEKQ